MTRWAPPSHRNAPWCDIKKEPSADLWAGQTDEGELGFTYEQADTVLEMLIDRKMSPEQVAEQGYSRELVDNIMHKMQQTQYKRQMPLIAKLSS